MSSSSIDGLAMSSSSCSPATVAMPRAARPRALVDVFTAALPPSSLRKFHTELRREKLRMHGSGAAQLPELPGMVPGVTLHAAGAARRR